ncbi:Cnga1, partial [Symbiodinium pilosum]
MALRSQTSQSIDQKPADLSEIHSANSHGQANPKIDSGSVDLLSELQAAHEHLEPHACWVEKPPTVRLKSIASVQSTNAYTVARAKGQQPCACILTPSGMFRNIWDMIGVFCLIWDIIMIPLQMFDLEAGVQTLLEWTSRLEMAFWFADMLLAFFTGFVEQGILVMDLPKIRRHYIRNWFGIDASILITDALLEFAFADSLGEVKAAKFLRLVRLLRIIRLGKLTHVSIVLRDQLKSRSACIQLNLCLVVLCIILLEHVVACCWHGIGSLSSEGSWLDVHGMRDQPVAFQYATAMRWSLSQLGIGGTEIEAVSYAESVYSVVVAFVSLISFSTVISSMTSLITSLNKAKVEETDQFWLLRKYLRDKRIAGSLAGRVTRFLQYAYHNFAVQIADHPHILQLLSKPLQGELNFRLYQSSILKISFLAEVSQSLISYSDSAFHKLASAAVHIVDA